MRIRVRRLSVLGLPTPPVGKAYCFFSGIAGVTGCEPPVDFGPGVTPALFSVEPLESLAAVESEFGLAPFVGPLPASFVDVEPPQESIADNDATISKCCNMCLICTCFIVEILLNEKLLMHKYLTIKTTSVKNFTQQSEILSV